MFAGRIQKNAYRRVSFRSISATINTKEKDETEAQV